MNDRPAVIPAAVPRFDGVDLLRGISILAVILLHLFIHLYFSGFKSIPTLLPYWLYHLLFWNGDNGVTVFFVISGFLITLTSLRRFGSLKEMSPRIFYHIRFARIAPLLLLLLFVLSILHLANVPGFHISPKIATLSRTLFAALTFHINWLEASKHGYLPPNWDVLWSLSVEEMFYLFFPIVTVLLYRFKRGKYFFIALLLVFVMLGPFQRAAWTHNPIWSDNSYLGGMDGIALGCLCALLTYSIQRGTLRLPRRSFLIALEVLGSAILLWIAIWPRWHWMRFIGRTALDGTLLSFGAAFIVLATVLHGSAPGQIILTRATAPIRWFGRNSYEIYLTHCFIIIAVVAEYQKLHPSDTLLVLAAWSIAAIALSALLGAVTSKYFSNPMNRLLRGAAPPHH